MPRLARLRKSKMSPQTEPKQEPSDDCWPAV